MAFDQPSLKGRALRLLSTREHSRAELERKLQRFEEEPGSLAAALDDLQAKGFISEQRVVESVLNRRAAKLGSGRIRQELQAKGLDPERVAEAVAALRNTELARAQSVWHKKFGSAPLDATEAMRQARFLAARGFGGEVIRRVLKGGAVELPDDVS
ncbi:MAG: recombination regulator RecX [Comamonadaceae bacterium CG_4_9_14_0_8_um_filter_57_21]|nr:MAG: recombination regulator RecX [Comamonadaceae bacterium CG_4_10_14_0_8_um_filter_57_29]PJC17915.1 MAG: recombination regulator RecX [Comamonadaceae bacterium CG_4_9_14_0_8_um_filter_57_21]